MEGLQQSSDATQVESDTLYLRFTDVVASRIARIPTVLRQLISQREQHQLLLASLNGTITSLDLAHISLISSHVEATAANIAIRTDISSVEAEKTSAVKTIQAEETQAEEKHDRETSQLKDTFSDQRAQLENSSTNHGSLTATNEKLRDDLAVSINDEGNLRVAGWQIEAQMREDKNVWRSCRIEHYNRTLESTKAQRAGEDRTQAAEENAKSARSELEISRSAFAVQMNDGGQENSTLEDQNEQLGSDNKALEGQGATQESACSTEISSLNDRLEVAEASARPRTECDILRVQDEQISDLASTVEAVQHGQAARKEEIQQHADARVKAEEVIEVLSQTLGFQATGTVSLSLTS